MVLLLLVAAGLILCVEYLKNSRFRIWAGLGVFLTFLAVGVLLPGHFAFQKVAGRLSMPTGLLWMVLFGVVILDIRTQHWRRALLSFAIFFSFTLSGNAVVGSFLIRQLESRLSTTSEDQQDPFDAVFILGGGTQLDPSGRAELGPSGDRIRRAAEMWHAQQAALLVASGRSPPPLGQGDLSEQTRDLLVRLGVPDERILRLSEPVNTTEEMRAYIDLATERGWRRVGLISSAWHLPRAMGHTRQTSIQFVPLPSDHRVGPPGPLDALDIIPSKAGFTLVGIWCWETLGRLVGR